MSKAGGNGGGDGSSLKKALSAIETVSQGHALKSHAGALIAPKTLFVRWLLKEAGVNEKADSQHD